MIYDKDSNISIQTHLEQQKNIKHIQSNKRKELSLLLGQGFKRMKEKPWKIIFPVLQIVGSLALWKWLDRFIYENTNTSEILLKFISYPTIALIILLTIILMVLIIRSIGTPKRMKQTTNSLLFMQTHFTNPLHCPLLLLYNEDKASGEIIMEFYSRWITYEHWVKHKNEVAGALGLRLVENGIRKGKGKHKIVLVGFDDNVVDYEPPHSSSF